MNEDTPRGITRAARPRIRFSLWVSQETSFNFGEVFLKAKIRNRVRSPASGVEKLKVEKLKGSTFDLGLLTSLARPSGGAFARAAASQSPDCIGLRRAPQQSMTRNFAFAAARMRGPPGTCRRGGHRAIGNAIILADYGGMSSKKRQDLSHTETQRHRGICPTGDHGSRLGEEPSATACGAALPPAR